MAKKSTEGLHKALETALELTNPLPCTHKKGGKNCVQQVESQFDDEGRSVLFFGEGCKVIDRFCPSCRAYWHIAVARNAIFDFDRISAFSTAEGEG